MSLSSTINKSLSKVSSFSMSIIAVSVSISGLACAESLYKGVVLDTNNAQAYIARPQGGVEAVKINNGESLWNVGTVDLPLMIQGQKLIAQKDAQQRGQLELGELSVSSGQLSYERVINVGGSVRAGIAEGLNDKFEVTISSGQNLNRESIGWSYKSKVAQGMYDENSQTAHEAFGEITFNAGQALENANTQIFSSRPDVARIAIEGRYLDGVDGRQFKSISGQYVLASQRKTDATLWKKYQWKIYSLNGRLLGEFDHINSYVPFEVIGDAVLYVTQPYVRYQGNNKNEAPLTLHAVSLSSSQNLWSKEIRNLSYQGPYPQ